MSFHEEGRASPKTGEREPGGDGGGAHAGKRPHVVQHLREESLPLRVAEIFCGGEFRADGEQVRGLETGSAARLANKATNQKPRAD